MLGRIDLVGLQRILIKLPALRNVKNNANKHVLMKL